MKRTVIALMLLVLLSGCAQVRGERVETGLPVQPDVLVSPADPAVARIGSMEEAPVFDFTATELFSRSSISGSELADDGALIMTFVVPDCAVCVSEGLEIAASALANPDVTYVVVHGSSEQVAYKAYSGQSGLYLENIVHIDDTTGALWRRFSVTSQPTTLLLSELGELRQSVGALGEQGHREAVLFTDAGN